MEGLVWTLMALGAGGAAEEAAKIAIINIRVHILAKLARELILIADMSHQATIHFIPHSKILYYCTKPPPSPIHPPARKGAGLVWRRFDVNFNYF